MIIAVAASLIFGSCTKKANTINPVVHTTHTIMISVNYANFNGSY